MIHTTAHHNHTHNDVLSLCVRSFFATTQTKQCLTRYHNTLIAILFTFTHYRNKIQYAMQQYNIQTAHFYD